MTEVERLRRQVADLEQTIEGLHMTIDYWVAKSRPDWDVHAWIARQVANAKP